MGSKVIKRSLRGLTVGVGICDICEALSRVGKPANCIPDLGRGNQNHK